MYVGLPLPVVKVRSAFGGAVTRELNYGKSDVD